MLCNNGDAIREHITQLSPGLAMCPETRNAT